MFKSLAVLFVGAISAQSCFAFNIGACSTFMNDGLFKKYQYQGFDNPGTKATKNVGSSKATFVVTTESSTASIDPKWWMHVTTSDAQYTSSWGACSGFGDIQLYQQRDDYYAQNRDEILREAAKGEGEHLKVLATYSLCEDQAVSEFAHQLQKRTSLLLKINQVGPVLDAMVMDEPSLKKACWSYGIAGVSVAGF